MIRVGRGLRRSLPDLLREHAPAPAYVVVSDDRVAALHGEPLRSELEAAGATASLLTFPAGETSKSPERWAELVEGFGDLGLGRDGCVVAVGGGVTGDLAGFAAATYARGVTLVNVPTSLLAMIDAAIGGKTGVDLRAGKNLAGAFHDPALVVVDPEVLTTLPPEELRVGLAEAVKHGAIADADYLDRLRESAAGILALEPDAIDPLVEGSIRIKTAVVARDAREGGERAILNFGHTIAHGIERATAYSVRHGRAVAVGVVAEAMIGEEIGVTRSGTAARLAAVLEALGLSATLPVGVDAGAVVAATRSDKKAREGRVRYALIEAPGVPARSEEGAWTWVVDDRPVALTLAALGHAPASAADV